ncbi:MAG: rubrerythrin family protein [Ruminococcaceae bacterium]|nr:rubrerythrin family protein [Oscillospiraceae bacterium]
MAAYVNGGVELEKLKGTKTETNLHTALSGESQAYLRYKWFEERAKNDGFVEISQIFNETAANEKEHAEIWFKCLGGWSSTENNLNTAAGGEHFEWETMYAQFANEAREEGFEDIAKLFERVASIEKNHEERFVSYLNSVRDGKVFTSDSTQTKWICLNCGYVVTAKEPPKICPTCSYPQGYFKKK